MGLPPPGPGEMNIVERLNGFRFVNINFGIWRVGVSGSIVSGIELVR